MLQDIVNLPMDEFNDLLSKRELTEEQLNLCRDIRRRGKNKVILLILNLSTSQTSAMCVNTHDLMQAL